MYTFSYDMFVNNLKVQIYHK